MRNSKAMAAAALAALLAAGPALAHKPVAEAVGTPEVARDGGKKSDAPAGLTDTHGSQSSSNSRKPAPTVGPAARKEKLAELRAIKLKDAVVLL